MRKCKRDEDDTQTRIVNATLALIAEKGADALRTREILERANVSNLSAISYYFGSLDNLRMLAIERYFDGVRSLMSGIEDQDDPRQALLEFCRRMSRFVLDNPVLERNIVFLAISGDQTAPFFSRIIGENIQVLRRLIARSRNERDQEKAGFDAIALASATIYPLLLATYGPGSVGIDANNENERERYFTNLIDGILTA